MSCFPVYYKEWKEITFGYKFLSWTGKAPHPGIDANKNQGKGSNGDLNEPAHAVQRGKTSVVQGGGGYGHQIILEHEDGTFSKYAHLNKILVKPGQMVEEGEIIGLIGRSGTTSAHLHHEVLTNKLVVWLQKTRPYSWWNFYPNGYSKAWVAEHYINPLAVHKYPPPVEIKKNMNILLVCNTPFTPHLLANRVNYVKEFYKQFKVDITFTLKRVDLKEIKWKGNFLEREWLAFNVVPYASGFDGLVLWLDPKDWKPTEKIGDSYPDQILGVHIMAIATTENYQDTRWDVPENAQFTGLLRHEISHMIAQRTGKWSNNTNEWKSGFDNTHHYDFTKKLEQFAPEINIDKFEGWVPTRGVRLFKYNNPSKLKWAFSGTLVQGKVYKSIDNRMFFECTKEGWKILTEGEFSSAIDSGKHWGYMSVPEANRIYADLGVPVPYSPPHHIMYELVTSTFREMFLKLLGWSENIPQNHLSS